MKSTQLHRADMRMPQGLSPGCRLNPCWKRALDLGLLILGLPVIAPLWLAIAAWIKLTSRGGTLFRQQRVGYGAETFTFYKFRSMRMNVDTGIHRSHLMELVDSDTPMTKLDVLGDPRLIPGGRFLRASGLDELPQLINILRGQMSWVGPRPCTTNELSLYRPHQLRRFLVLPGLTGFWQVNGKNKTTFTEMIKLDEYYVDHRSFLLDLGILARTPAVLASQTLEMLQNVKLILRRWDRKEKGPWTSISVPEPKS